MRVAAPELQAAQIISKVLAKMADASLNLSDVVEFLEQLSECRTKCRPGGLAFFHGKVEQWLIGQLEDLSKREVAKDTSSGVDAIKADLGLLKKSLAAFPSVAAVAALKEATNMLKDLHAIESQQNLMTLTEATIEKLTSDNIVGMVDSLPSTLNDEMSDALDKCATRLREHCNAMALNFFDDASEAALLQGITNLAAIIGRIDHKGPLTGLMTKMHEKAVGIKVAYAKHQGNPARANQVSFNRAMVGWQSIVLSRDEANEYMVSFLKSFILGLKDTMIAHDQLQAKKVEDATGELKILVDELDKIAFGKKDGSSWKVKVTPKMTLKQVIDVAHEAGGLVAGPGHKVSATKQQLAEASSTSCSSRGTQGAVYF